MARKKTAAGDNPPWYEQCLKNIERIPGGTLCSQQHCEEASKYSLAICTCQPPYLNGCNPTPTPGCCAYNASSPVYVPLPGGGCYCCCGGAMSTTEVAVSKTGRMAADQLKKGDTVYVPKDASLRQWTNAPLQFVSASKASADNLQVLISLRDAKGKEQQLITGAKQLLMLADKKLKEARKLVPGIDRLMNSEGKAVDIEKVDTGAYTTFISYLSLTAAPAADPAGHLISLNGFIAGDYALTMGIAEEHLSANHHSLPDAGTKEYRERYPHLY